MNDNRLLLILVMVLPSVPALSQENFLSAAFNLTSTYEVRKPSDSRIGTLAEREPIHGWHLGLGHVDSLGSRWALRYAATFDQFGFKTLIKNDQVRESYLGAQLFIRYALSNSLSAVSGVFAQT